MKFAAGAYTESSHVN